MFEGLSNFTEMMGTLKRLRGDLARAEQDVKKIEVEGSAGGGMVRVRMNGQLEVLACELDPSVVKSGDVELLEDLICAAVNQAVRNAREAATDRYRDVSGKLDLPGLDELLGKPRR